MIPQLTTYYDTKSANVQKAPIMLRFLAFTMGRDNARDNNAGCHPVSGNWVAKSVASPSCPIIPCDQ
jgi:hypothetical protein